MSSIDKKILAPDFIINSYNQKEDKKSLISFLNTIGDFGIQTQNDYEVEYSRMPEIKFFISNFSIPGFKLNSVQIFFNGRALDIPTTYDFDHDFQITVLNDANGILYQKILNLIKYDINSNYPIRNPEIKDTMRIRSYMGDTYAGSTIELRGVRMYGLSELQFGYSNNDIQTFNVNCKCLGFNITNGENPKVNWSLVETNY